LNSFSDISAPHVLKGPEGFSLFMTLDLVAIRAEQLIAARSVSEHPKVVRQSSAVSPAYFGATATIDMVYLQRPNVFIISAGPAPRAILRVNLP